MDILKRILISILVVTFALSGATVAMADVGAVDSAKVNKKLMNKIDRLENRIKQLEMRPTGVQVTEVAEVYTPATTGGVVRAMEDIQLSGYVETMFTVATSQPGTGYYNDIGGNRAGINELRSFDRLNNSFTMNQLKLTLQKDAPETGGIGFRGDIIFGEDAKWLNRVTNQTGPMRLIYQRLTPAQVAIVNNVAGGPPLYDGLDSGNQSNVFIENAYAQLIAPYGNGIDIRAGIMTSLIGFDKIENKDNWSASRGLLFNLGGPFVSTGVRAKYDWDEKFTTILGVNNGGNRLVAASASKTLEGLASYQLTDWLKLSTAINIGNESPSGGNNWGHAGYTLISDSIIEIEMNDKWDMAIESILGATDKRGSWFGVGVWNRYALNDWIKFNHRFEWFNDTSNYRLDEMGGNTVEDLGDSLYDDGYDAWEMTFGVDFNIYTNLLTRLEYRFDITPGTDMFDGNRSDQSTFLASLIYEF